MTTKINGAAYPGIWVEKRVSFVKLTFNTDISALAAADLTVLGTATAAGAGTVADSTFGIVESAIVQALKTLEMKATVLGISSYDATSFNVDVMLGVSEGYFSDINGVIATAIAVPNAQAFVTTAGAAPTNVAGALVSVRPASVTFSMTYAAFDGNMAIGTLANGTLEFVADGASPGSAAAPMGASGYYPVLLAAA